jgi:hypothetical protein
MSSFKAVGVRYRMQDSMPAQKSNHDATTGLELQADEWMPDVIGPGIVYEDRVLDLSGESLIATKGKTAEEMVLDEIAEGFVVKDVKKLSIGMKALAGTSSIKKKKWPKKF